MEWRSAPEVSQPLATRRRFQEFHALYEISQSLCAIDDLDRLLQFAVQRAASLLGVEASAVLLLDERRQELYFKVVAESRLGVTQQLRQIRFPADQGIAGWVLRERVSSVVSDVECDPRFSQEVDVQTRVKTKSYLCVPLKTRERSLGVLTAVNKCQGFFSADDVRLAEAFASQLAVALDNARLTEKLAMVQGQRRGRSPFVQKEHQSGTGLSALIGQGARMQEVYWLSEQILHTTTTVLLTGESGTGKDLMARIIHAHGARAKGPFIAVNCAAIPEALLEAELFGYERGAFTNATQRKPGRFELAAGGTLFLDEIGEMSPALQAKLLRVLQEKQFERLGSTKTTRTDVRTIAATNRNLPQLIAEGKFREDLFYRLNVYPIPLPPLRERREDILPLAEHFLQRFTKGLGKDGVVLSKDVRERLMRHTWPGNVRELENVIERAAILCRGTEVTLQELPSSLQEQGEEHNPRVGHGRMPVGVTLAELEKQCIVQALERVNYNQLRASRLLGLSRTQLRTRMRNYGLEKKAMTITYAAQPLEQAFGREERREFLLQ